MENGLECRNMDFLAKIESYFEELFSGLFKKGQANFVFWFAVIFLGTLVILSSIGLLPSELQEESNGNNFIEEGRKALDSAFGNKNNETPAVQASSTVTQPSQQTPSRGIGYGILPSRLIIPAINLNTAVDNPTSTSTASLDYELTKGPVRYPGSGTVGFGNMFIFGHSTGWKVVINKAYKVFNDLKTLTPGEVIYITAGEKTYEYRVRQVTKVDKNDTLITFDTTVNMLTLSTCDSFGAKTDRYVVTADFVGVK
jgi:LPXTG-site transpeptidase (sortase) family protein